MAKQALVLVIDRTIYDRIRTETVQCDAEKKIAFLVRYVPRLRMSPRNIIEELDILFIKECFTKGYRILKKGDFDENVYFIKEGQCRVMAPVNNSLNGIKSQLTPEENAKYKYATLSIIGVGQSFGEDSGLNENKVQETVQAESEIVETYKISRAMLLQYFGGSASEVIYSIRANLQAKKNWNQLKLAQYNSMSKDKLIKENVLVDEDAYNELEPTKTVPGEVPYLKMVQTYGKPSVEAAMKLTKEEEKKAEEAVLPPPPKMELRPKPRNEFMVAKAANEEVKNDTLRGFGTMRLVPSNRMQHMTQEKMRGLETLRNIAQERRTGGAKPGPKANFDQGSIKKFQNSVMMADPAILANKSKATEGSSGLNLFRKMKDFESINIKDKIGQ